MHRQITFCELRCKDVINVLDGRCLGNIVDLAIDCYSGLVIGLILPGVGRFFNLLKGEQIFVPWQNICKIGEDVILVELCDFDGVRGCAVKALVQEAPSQTKPISTYYEDYTPQKASLIPAPEPYYSQIQAHTEDFDPYQTQNKTVYYSIAKEAKRFK